MCDTVWIVETDRFIHFKTRERAEEYLRDFDWKLERPGFPVTIYIRNGIQAKLYAAEVY